MSPKNIHHPASWIISIVAIITGLSLGYDRIQANNNYGYSIPTANFTATSRPNNDATYHNLRVRADVDVSDRTKVNFMGIYLSDVAKEIVAQHVGTNQKVERYLYPQP